MEGVTEVIQTADDFKITDSRACNNQKCSRKGAVMHHGKYCGTCGEPFVLALVCKCGELLRAYNKYCQECGKKYCEGK